MVRNKREFSSQLNIHFPFNMKYICRDWSFRSSNTDIQLWTADSSASTDQAGVSNGGGVGDTSIWGFEGEKSGTAMTPEWRSSL